MKTENKLSLPEIIGLIVIVLILLYFPYKMITEHILDNIANSYYHPTLCAAVWTLNPKNGNWHVRVWLRLVHFHGHDARSLRLWPSPVG